MWKLLHVLRQVDDQEPFEMRKSSNLRPCDAYARGYLSVVWEFRYNMATLSRAYAEELSARRTE
jgi:hypothetical protein